MAKKDDRVLVVNYIVVTIDNQIWKPKNQQNHAFHTETDAIDWLENNPPPANGPDVTFKIMPVYTFRKRNHG